tara:strand:- start:161 stop:370 length:210 start_codon:yes stop_codon:yes gene_type:complete
MKLKNKIILTTFSLFMIEAIVHYNQGKNEAKKKEETKGFLPPTKSLIKLGLIVGVFSVINGLLIENIES